MSVSFMQESCLPRILTLPIKQYPTSRKWFSQVKVQESAALLTWRTFLLFLLWCIWTRNWFVSLFSWNLIGLIHLFWPTHFSRPSLHTPRIFSHFLLWWKSSIFLFHCPSACTKLLLCPRLTLGLSLSHLCSHSPSHDPLPTANTKYSLGQMEFTLQWYL